MACHNGMVGLQVVDRREREAADQRLTHTILQCSQPDSSARIRTRLRAGKSETLGSNPG